MRILAVNFNNKYVKTSNKYKNTYNNNDCFVRTISFGNSTDAKTFSEFKNWATESNFLKKASNIMASSENILGNGHEGTVYEIPNCDDWVIKKFKRSNLIQYHVDKPEIIEIDDISPKLNIGQKIASVRIPISDRYSEHFYILKKQNGHPLGVHQLLMNNVSAGSKKMHLDSLEEIAKLPTSSYKKLIDDIDYVVNCGYQFDGENPQNYLLDRKNARIRFVDINDINTEGKTQYSEVLYALLGSSFNERFMNSHRPNDEKEHAERLSSAICAKFLSAMNLKNAKFSNTVHFIQLLKSKSFTNILGTDDLREKMRILAENNLL